jgi:hypothetical protein
VNVSAANFRELYREQRRVRLKLGLCDFADFHGRVGAGDYCNKRHPAKNSLSVFIVQICGET